MKRVYFLLVALVFLGKEVPGQDRVIRFVIASFETEGLYEDISKKIRPEFESQFFALFEECNQYIEFIPEEIDDQSSGNYLLNLKVEADNFGSTLRIKVFRVEKGTPRLILNKNKNIPTSFNALYNNKARLEFIKELLDISFPQNTIKKWLREEGITDDCFNPSEDVLKRKIEWKLMAPAIATFVSGPIIWGLTIPDYQIYKNHPVESDYVYRDMGINRDALYNKIKNRERIGWGLITLGGMGIVAAILSNQMKRQKNKSDKEKTSSRKSSFYLRPDIIPSAPIRALSSPSYGLSLQIKF